MHSNFFARNRFYFSHDLLGRNFAAFREFLAILEGVFLHPDQARVVVSHRSHGS